LERQVGSMEESRMDFPELVGKTVAELSVHDDPIYGREVLVQFTDQTQLSICVGVKQTIDARYWRDGAPDQPMFSRQE
jgi:hypothetical protein